MGFYDSKKRSFVPGWSVSSLHKQFIEARNDHLLPDGLYHPSINHQHGGLFLPVPGNLSRGMFEGSRHDKGACAAVLQFTRV